MPRPRPAASGVEVSGGARHHRPATAGPLRVGRTAPCVGRRDSLDTLRRVLDLDRQRRGQPHVMFLEGEAGIGKTRLLDEATGRLDATWHVIRSAADPLQRLEPFSALAALQERRHATTPEVSASRPLGPGRRAQLVDDLVAQVDELARSGPCVLVVEDLHWADPGSLAVVRELCDPLPGRRLVILGTLRPSPRPQHLDHLLAEVVPALAAVLRVGPLDDASVTDLVAALTGHPPGPRLGRQLARAGGNPLFLVQLLGALAEQGSLHRTVVDGQAVAEVAHSSLPLSLRTTLLRQLSLLPRTALEALRVAALLGSTFTPAEVALGLDEPVTRVLPRFRIPLEAGWVQADGERLAFRHDLIRAALYDDTPEAVRQSLHRHLADRLREAGRDRQRIAYHLLRSAVPPDLEAAGWLHDTGRDLAARDPERAVAVLEAACSLAPAAEALRDRIEADLGVAQLWAGRVEDGERTLRALLNRRHDREVDAVAGLALARSLILGGRTEEALDLLRERATAAAGVERLAFVAERAVAHLLRGEIDDADGAVAEVLSAPDDAGDESRCLALSVRCATVALRARFGDAIEVGRGAVALAAASPDPEVSRRPPELFLGSVLLDADAFEEGWAVLDAGRRRSEELGAVWDLPLVHLVAARGRYLAGALDDALAEVETALALADDVGTHVLEVWGHAIAAHVHLHRMDPGPVEAALQAGEAAVSLRGPQVRGTDWLLWARARRLALDGQHAAARELLLLVWHGLLEVGARSELRLLGPELVRAHRTAQDLAAADTVAATLAEVAAEAGSTSAAAAAAHSRGLADGDPEPVVAAATLTSDTGCRLEHALQSLDAADLLAATGATEPAAHWYERTIRVADDCGLTRAVRRARAGQRRLGIRAGAAGGRGRPRTGWQALTPTELEVARLAAQGLSNPQIGAQLYVSRRTVQTHLSQVFRKLGISSRVELAARMARRARPS